MLKKKVFTILALALSFIVLTGCGSTSPEANKPIGVIPTTQTTQTTQTTYPLTLEDELGVTVNLVAQPKRIISMVPAATETLFALGLEGKVVAVTKWDNNPKDVQTKVEYVFEDSLHPNLEQILNLNPDLIVLSMMGYEVKDIDAIRKLGVPVFAIDPQTIQATYQTIETFGKLTNTQDQATKLVADMKEKEQAILSKVATIEESERLRVWTEVDENLYTPGEGTFLNELITKAGGNNIAADVQGWGQYNSEQVITKNPQVIFETYNFYKKDAVEVIIARNGWQNVEAVKNKRVLGLDSDMVTRPGPRIIDGLESIAKALYPKLF